MKPISWRGEFQMLRARSLDRLSAPYLRDGAFRPNPIQLRVDENCAHCGIISSCLLKQTP
jgi:hypothetical protein